MKRMIPLFVGIGVCVLAAIAQQDGKPSATNKPKPRADANAHEIKIDLKNRRITFEADVCRRFAPDSNSPADLEVFVSKWQEKTHESILHTKVSGWKIHAGLVAMGLTRGKPAKWEYDIEEEEGKLYPPRGGEVAVRLRWKDDSGKVRTAKASDWIQASQKNVKVPDRWVFVGSEVIPGVGYVADLGRDYGGGVFISTSNFAGAIIDVPFTSSADNAELFFRSVPAAIPPVGTKVEVIVEPVKGAEKAAHARAILDIDRFGRLKIEGRQGFIQPDELSRWASDFIDEHNKGQVIIRAAAKSLIFDVWRARQELWIGMARDIEIQRMGPDSPVLPRTPDQAKRALQAWGNRFANAHEEVRDPALEADYELQAIRQKVHELKVTREFLENYRDELKAKTDEFRKAREDADGEDDNEPEPDAE